MILASTGHRSAGHDGRSSVAQVNGRSDVDLMMNSLNTGANPPRRASSMLVTSAVAIWLAVVVTASIQMIAYSNAPGRSGTPPAEWPVQSQIPLQAGLPNLVMFAHPRCPCTRASLGELERLMASASGRLAAQVVFIKPVGMAKDWAHTDLWRTASAIPGVTVHEDDAGSEARRFRSETSGHALLYDAGGRLRFHGGITFARGHAGDNPGRSAVMALLREPESAQFTTAVFGCALFETDCQEGGAECHK